MNRCDFRIFDERLPDEVIFAVRDANPIEA